MAWPGNLQPVVKRWLLVFVGAVVLTSCVYGWWPLQGAVGTALSYTLLPGVALYAALNGSVLFGAGFGGLGNYLVIALGSAVAWTGLAVALVWLVFRVRSRSQG
ncbi:MAG: hypothetical protein ACK40L_11350 [Hydrogenophaga sp.]